MAPGADTSTVIPEIHFIGELERGTDFDVDAAEGIFVEYSVSCGDSWWDLTKGTQQTQTSYADEENEVVFAHPVDLHFSSTAVGEWPRLNFHVFK